MQSVRLDITIFPEITQNAWSVHHHAPLAIPMEHVRPVSLPSGHQVPLRMELATNVRSNFVRPALPLMSVLAQPAKLDIPLLLMGVVSWPAVLSIIAMTVVPIMHLAQPAPVITIRHPMEAVHCVTMLLSVLPAIQPNASLVALDIT